MVRRLLSDERGSVLIFTTALLVFLLVFVGLAVDLAYFMSVKGEVQRAVDAAALAGAGKLGFTHDDFTPARQFAQAYGTFNGYHGPAGPQPVALDLNSVDGGDNASADGDIVLGVWNGTSFAASNDASVVNAVRCQKSVQVPTTFLRLLGINTLNLFAVSGIAVANPPMNPPPPPVGCLAPMVLSDCPFVDPTRDGFTRDGCGIPMSFISSCSPTLGGCNTAGWANLLNNGTPNPSNVPQQIDNAARGTGECPGYNLSVGGTIQVTNGMDQPIMNELERKFRERYEASLSNPPITIVNSESATTYTGYGWDIYVPVVSTGSCPPQPINGSLQITGFTRFVMTQVINMGECAVNNGYNYPNNAWAQYCPGPAGQPATNPQPASFRAVFGYYDCTKYDSPPVPVPGPTTALATKLRLVR